MRDELEEMYDDYLYEQKDITRDEDELLGDTIMQINSLLYEMRKVMKK